MDIEIREEPRGQLIDYADLSIAFEVRSVLEVSLREGGLGGFGLVERAVASPYPKDYDAIPGNHPSDWGKRFDLSGWPIFSARHEGVRVGGAVVAFATEGVQMLDGRCDLAVLWDLRVAPDARGQGVGTALFAAVEQWARERACTQLKIETQNVNVGACRFYAARGCTLGALHRFAYPDLPDEVQLLWYKDLGAPLSSA